MLLSKQFNEANRQRGRTDTSSSASASSASSTFSCPPDSLSLDRKRSRAKGSKKETPPEKRRVRTGCLTCRSKHKKCDEHKPVCDFCAKKGYECIWQGPKKSDYVRNTLSDFLSLQNSTRSLVDAMNGPMPLTSATESNNRTAFALTQFQDLQMGRSQSLSDNPATFGEAYALTGSTTGGTTTPMLKNSQSCFSSISLDDSSASSLPRRTSVLSPVKEMNFYYLPKTMSNVLTMYLSMHNRSVGTRLPNDECTFELFADKSTNVRPPLLENENLFLIDFYKEEVASLLMPDRDQVHIFIDMVPQMALDFPPLHFAILALSSRMLQLLTPRFVGEHTLDFYNGALQELSLSLRGWRIPHEDEQTRTAIMATTVLLGYFEVLSVDLRECAGRFSAYFEFLRAFSIPNIRSPIVHTLLKSSELLEVVVAEFSTSTLSAEPTGYSSNSIYEGILTLVSRIERLARTNLTDNVSAWTGLWNKLNRWESEVPEEYRSLIDSGDSNGRQTFLHLNCLACLQLYFVARFMLLNSKPRDVDLHQHSAEESCITGEVDELPRGTLMAMVQETCQRLIVLLRESMSWKNRHSVGSLLISFFCAKKMLDSGRIVPEQRAALTQNVRRIESWSGISLMSWLVQREEKCS